MFRKHYHRVVFILVCALGTANAADPGWPFWRGAAGNGAASETGIDYVDTLTDAKLLWTSEALVIGTYVGSCTGKSGRMSSGVSSPIAADGKVFLYYYKGADEPVVPINGSYKEDRHESYEDSIKARHQADPFYKKHVSYDEFFQLVTNVYAKDHVVCMDANTGKTLWDIVLPGLTANIKRSNSKLEPAYANGMLVAASEAGRLCGIDVETGKITWTWVDQAVADKVAQDLKEAVANKRFARRRGTTANLMIADGVVLYCAAKQGMMGFDLASGEHLWTQPELEHERPLRWSHAGKEYGIVGGKCFDPRTGDLVWEASGVWSGGKATPALSAQYIVYGETKEGGLSCFRISADKAELVWALPKERDVAKLKSGNGSPCIVGDHVYGIMERYRHEGQQVGLLLCVELATGKIVAEQIIGVARGGEGGHDGCTSLFSFGKVLCYRSASKSINGSIIAWSIAPEPLGSQQVFRPQSCNVAASPSVAGGKLFLRGTGHILCYDLRKQP